MALTALLLAVPILLPIMILLRTTGEREIFYHQERIGLKNHAFAIKKFATMVRDSAQMDGGLSTVRNDPRVTAVGKYLRMTKLNEIPQLVNVLKGEMSFVGPRPLTRGSFENYSPKVKAKIYEIRPGLTGIGSIVFRDEELIMTRIHETGRDRRAYYRQHILPVKGRLELWYQESQSFYTDFKLVALTALVIVHPKAKLARSFFKNLPKFGNDLDRV